MKKIFLTAEWNYLIMANYEIEPALLLPYLPAHTKLDLFDGKAYASLVGFMFERVKIKGISVPFHTHFPEVNLRFYVKHTAADGSIRRGVVFISEIVPKKIIAWIANTFYKEKYIATHMQQFIEHSSGALNISYGWQWKGRHNHIAANVNNLRSPIVQQTKEAFIFEHYYGFARAGQTKTNQYSVEHPVWNTYPVLSYDIDCDFANQYGPAFAFLRERQPASVFVAEGSAVVVREKTVLTGPDQKAIRADD